MTTKNFEELAGKEIIEKAAKALAEHNFASETVATGAEAFARIKELIPAGVTVMNGASKTLEQIGYVDYLASGKHPWVNPKDAILAEKDPAKQALMRKQSVVSNWYLGSAHAVTEDGRLVFASNTGSQMPALAYTATNILLIVSAKKIVPTLDDAFQRIKEYIVPLENENMQQKYKVDTNWRKTFVLNNEGEKSGRTVRVIFVNEKLGF